MADFPDSAQTTIPIAEKRPIILIGDIAVDLLTREAPSSPIQLTTHPIEYGEEIADYAIKLTETLVLDCKFLSDYIGGGVNVDQYSRAHGGRSPMTWRDKRDRILAAKDAVQILDVSTGYATYTDMVLVDYILDRRPQTSDSWTVQLFFQKARLTKPQWASVPIDRIPADKRSQKLRDGATKGRGKRDAGERPGKDTSETQSTKYTSWLRGLGVEL